MRIPFLHPTAADAPTTPASAVSAAVLLTKNACFALPLSKKPDFIAFLTFSFPAYFRPDVRLPENTKVFCQDK